MSCTIQSTFNRSHVPQRHMGISGVAARCVEASQKIDQQGFHSMFDGDLLPIGPPQLQDPSSILYSAVDEQGGTSRTYSYPQEVREQGIYQMGTQIASGQIGCHGLLSQDAGLVREGYGREGYIYTDNDEANQHAPFAGVTCHITTQMAPNLKAEGAACIHATGIGGEFPSRASSAEIFQPWNIDLGMNNIEARLPVEAGCPTMQSFCNLEDAQLLQDAYEGVEPRAVSAFSTFAGELIQPDRNEAVEPGREALELAMDDLDPLGMSQSLDPCLGMPHLDHAAPLAYPYPLDFIGLPQEPHLGEKSDTPDGDESDPGKDRKATTRKRRSEDAYEEAGLKAAPKRSKVGRSLRPCGTGGITDAQRQRTRETARKLRAKKFETFQQMKASVVDMSLHNQNLAARLQTSSQQVKVMSEQNSFLKSVLLVVHPQDDDNRSPKFEQLLAIKKLLEQGKVGCPSKGGQPIPEPIALVEKPLASKAMVCDGPHHISVPI